MTTPWTTQPGPEPSDPDLSQRYRRDALAEREDQRAQSAWRAAHTPPSRTPRGVIRLLAAVLVLTLVAFTAVVMLGPMLRQSETTDQSLPAGTSRLVVKNHVGQVRVRAGAPGETPRVSSTVEWGLRRPSATVTSIGDEVTLAGSCPSFVSTVCRTDWVVVVPRNTDLSIEQGAGRVVLEAPGGDVAIQSGVGTVEVSGARSREVSVELGVGTVEYEGVTPPDRVDVSLGVGDVTLQLPDTVPYRVDSTGAGASQVDNRLGHDPSALRRITVEVGVGDATLDAS